MAKIKWSSFVVILIYWIDCLIESETSTMGLLSADRSNAEYLDESCTKASSREEFHGPCVRQIEIYDWTTSHSDRTEIGTRTELDCTV